MLTWGNMKGSTQKYFVSALALPRPGIRNARTAHRSGRIWFGQEVLLQKIAVADGVVIHHSKYSPLA